VSTQPKPRLTPEEYLAIERAAEFRSEYYDGEMFAMAGTSERHSMITGALYASLRGQMRGKHCRAYSSEMRVRVGNGRLYTYPDISAVCGERKFADNEFDVLLNPNFIAEVLSPSTEAYDRGRKFEQYRTIESLSQYLLIAQDRVHLDLYTKSTDGWNLKSYDSLTDQVELQSIGCTVAIADLYEEIDLAG
jgi:Uma2 family endonuclease